ncbi:MAG: radical SAM protein, partial [Candidatus Omnitrophica bacterium]|nr:radical SAM protein [Candidatus Omnitrophota bacterium]
TVVIGEVEDIWQEVLEDFSNGNLKKFYRNKHPVDLTKSPLPRYDLVKKEHYKVIWIQTTRGCPIDCEFCSASKVFGLKLRHKKIDQVIKEIKLIKSLWEVPRISFADDNIVIDKKYAIELVKELKSLNIRWFIQADISIGDDDVFLKLLKESGCAIVFVGFESISKDSLKHTDRVGFKYNRVGKYQEYIKKIQSYGIGIMGAFIVGLDSDDASIFYRTANFIVDNRLYAAQITVLTPLPGTRLRERLEKESRLLSHPWDNYTFLDVNFIPKNMTPGVLQQGLYDIYRKVYSQESAVKRAQHFKQIYKSNK